MKLLDELGLTPYAEIFRGSPAGGADVSSLIERAWSVERVKQLYDAYVEEFGPYRNAATRQRLPDRDAFRIRTRAVHQFRQFVELDPELPGPSAEQESRRRAVETFREVYDALAEIAQSYFDRITQVGTPVRA